MLDGLGINELLELLLLSDQEVVLMSVSLGGHSVVSWDNGDHGGSCGMFESQMLPGATFCPSTTGTGKLAGAVATWLAWWKAVWAGLVLRRGAMGSPEHTLATHSALITLLTIDHRGGEVRGGGGATEGVVGAGRGGDSGGQLGAGGRETEQSS